MTGRTRPALLIPTLIIVLVTVGITVTAMLSFYHTSLFAVAGTVLAAILGVALLLRIGRSAFRRLEESEAKYRTLFETMGKGVVYQNERGEITSANPAAERILGLTIDQMVGRASVDPRWQAIHEDGSPFPGRTHPAMVALESGEPVSDVLMGIIHPDAAEHRWIIIDSIPQFKAGEERPSGVFSTFTDITEIKKAEESSRKEKEFAESLVEVAQVIVLVLDTDGRIVSYNPFMENLSGIPLEDAVGRDWFTTFLPPGDHDRIRKLFRDSVQDINACGNVNPIVTKEGAERQIEWYDRTLKDSKGTVQSVLAIGLDITERLAASETLRDSRDQLRALSSYLQESKETEMARIARAIHDELGQNLTGIMMDLESLRNTTPVDRIEQHELLDSIATIASDTVQRVKRIAAEVRPGLLDDLGVASAIEWLSEEFTRQTDIPCVLDLDPPDLVLEHGSTTAFFRIFQELLSNIHRHAGATAIDVKLRVEQFQVILEVFDNGRGITGEKITSPTSLGLMGMRERVTQLDGTFSIVGREGEGTRAAVLIPCRR